MKNPFMNLSVAPAESIEFTQEEDNPFLNLSVSPATTPAPVEPINEHLPQATDLVDHYQPQGDPLPVSYEGARVNPKPNDAPAIVNNPVETSFATTLAGVSRAAGAPQVAGTNDTAQTQQMVQQAYARLGMDTPTSVVMKLDEIRKLEQQKNTAQNIAPALMFSAGYAPEQNINYINEQLSKAHQDLSLMTQDALNADERIAFLKSETELYKEMERLAQERIATQSTKVDLLSNIEDFKSKRLETMQNELAHTDYIHQRSVSERLADYKDQQLSQMTSFDRSELGLTTQDVLNEILFRKLKQTEALGKSSGSQDPMKNLEILTSMQITNAAPSLPEVRYMLDQLVDSGQAFLPTGEVVSGVVAHNLLMEYEAKLEETMKKGVSEDVAVTEAALHIANKGTQPVENELMTTADVYAGDAASANLAMNINGKSTRFKMVNQEYNTNVEAALYHVLATTQPGTPKYVETLKLIGEQNDNINQQITAFATKQTEQTGNPFIGSATLQLIHNNDIDAVLADKLVSSEGFSTHNLRKGTAGAAYVNAYALMEEHGEKTRKRYEKDIEKERKKREKKGKPPAIEEDFMMFDSLTHEQQVEIRNEFFGTFANEAMLNSLNPSIMEYLEPLSGDVQLQTKVGNKITRVLSKLTDSNKSVDPDYARGIFAQVDAAYRKHVGTPPNVNFELVNVPHVVRGSYNLINTSVQSAEQAAIFKLLIGTGKGAYGNGYDGDLGNLALQVAGEMLLTDDNVKGLGQIARSDFRQGRGPLTEVGGQLQHNSQSYGALGLGERPLDFDHIDRDDFVRANPHLADNPYYNNMDYNNLTPEDLALYDYNFEAIWQDEVRKAFTYGSQLQYIDPNNITIDGEIINE